METDPPNKNPNKRTSEEAFGWDDDADLTGVLSLVNSTIRGRVEAFPYEERNGNLATILNVYLHRLPMLQKTNVLAQRTPMQQVEKLCEYLPEVSSEDGMREDDL